MDHSTPTLAASADGSPAWVTPEARAQVERLRENCARHGIELFDFDGSERGIVHVIGPELGLTQPGMTIVRSEEHTSELQSLMRISYAVFCLKKKKTSHHN